MKYFSMPFLLILFFTYPAVIVLSRDVQDFNFDWKFNLEDNPDAKNLDFSDAHWRLIHLPHDWSIEQVYTTENTSGSMAFLPTGIGWYRKSFNVDTKQKDSVTQIEFDGVYCNAEVWINGHYLGKRPYGYSAFAYDLSAYLNYGTKNTIAVRVDHSNFADSRWYTGSGIYRNVRLLSTSKTFVPRFGAWIETPEVSEKHADIKVTAVVQNRDGRIKKLSVKVVLNDASGAEVASAVQRMGSTGNDTCLIQLKLKNPKLWDIKSPNMYNATVLVYSGSVLCDTYSFDFGIRSIHFDADKGFFLNQQKLKLKGVCLHHDAGAAGSVFIRDVWARRLSSLKDIGVNAIRMSHNPADPGLLCLCDELGFVVINEAFDEWRRNKEKWITSRFANDMRPELESGYGDIFEEWAERDVKDMVRYSRNHPSIIMWSMGNEIEWTYPYYWKMSQSNQGLGNQVLMEETGDSIDELKETALQIKKWIKEIDKTRFVTSGGVLPKSGNITGYFDVPDVMGYNYRAENYDEDHRNYPQRIMYGSENWGTYQEWKDAVDRDFIAGIFVWTGIAYMGESGPFPWKGLELSFLDFAGFYTPRGHFYKTLWSDEPSTYLATKHIKKAQWLYRNGTFVDNRVRFWLDKWLFEDVEETWNYSEGDSVFVEVFSNSPEVELFVNSQSFGIKKTSDFSDRIVKYLVPFQAGEIKAEGLNIGVKESEYALKTALNIGQIELVADRTQMSANGYDLAHIVAYTKTQSGDLVPDKEVQLIFSIEGEAVNLGVDNGWERNVQKHKSNQIVTHNGKALMLVQSTRKAGEIKITARAGKLISNEILIRVE